MLGKADRQRAVDGAEMTCADANSARTAPTRRCRAAIAVSLMIFAMSLVLAASASASCKRPLNSVWTGTITGPQQSSTFESSVAVSTETYPGSEIMNISGHTHSSGHYLVYPESLSGTFTGTVTCAGVEHFQAIVSGLVGTGPGATPVSNLVVNYTGNAYNTGASGFYENSLGETGSWTASLFAVAESQGTQPGEVELINPSTTLATAFLAQPAQPGLPPGVVAPVGSVSYEVSEVSPYTTISVTFKLPPGSAPVTVYKLVEGEYIEYPASKTKISGEQITLEITDNGPWDEDPTAGVIRDPLVPVQSQVGSPPAVGLNGESGVTQTSATLEGEVEPNGGAVSNCEFEYGTTTSYGSSAPCSALPGSENASEPVSASLTGLAANTTYHYRLVASNPGGTTESDDETFQTLPEPPTVVTGEASSITQTSATLSATVNPNGGELGECYFDVSGHSELSEEECSPEPGSETEPVTVTVNLEELYPNTEYHYWIYAENEGGASIGHELTFTTLPYHSPDIALGTPDSITQTSATVNATVDRNGEPLEECNIEYGTSETYGSGVECTPTPGSGTGPEPVSATFTGLEPNTTYHYRVSTGFLGNAGHSADGTFTTQTYVPPTVLTGAASSITQTSATLNGSVDPNGEEVETCEMQFGPTSEYGSSAPCEPGALSGTAPIAVSVQDTGLTPGTTYHFRILATGLHRAVEGGDETFTTLPSAPAPTITKLSAKKGAAAGGTRVTIAGTGFTGATAVRFGATDAKSFTVVSATSITAESPAETTGSVEVSVSAPGGTSAATTSAKFVFGSPTITALSTHSGPTSGGTVVTVTGSGFALGNATTFTFKKARGASVSCTTTSQCTVTAPRSTKAGTVDVVATSARKKSKKSAADHFTYTTGGLRKRGSSHRSHR
jgi:phosphodiesterase/alkaline phosphatase D-like protein